MDQCKQGVQALPPCTAPTFGMAFSPCAGGCQSCQARILLLQQWGFPCKVECTDGCCLQDEEVLAERQAAAEASGDDGAILVAAGLRPELASTLVPPSHGHEAAEGDTGEPFHVKYVAFGNRRHLQTCSFQTAMPSPLDRPCSQSGCLMSRLQMLRCVQAIGRGRSRS